MKAEKLIELGRWVASGDVVIVECQGYELEPFAIETNELEGTLTIRCLPPAFNDAPDADDDEGENEGSTLPWEDVTFTSDPVCALPEKPSEILAVDEPAPKEG